MPGGGTRTFLEPDHYEASLGQSQIAAVIVPRGKFRARLTWAELYHLQVLRCEEDSPRIAYVQLAPGLTPLYCFQQIPSRRGYSAAERCRQATTSCSTAVVSGCISRRRALLSGA
jgi:hypothetical protein